MLCCFDCVCAAWLIDKVHFIGLLPNVFVVMLLLFSREFGSILIRVVLSIWRIGVWNTGVPLGVNGMHRIRIWDSSLLHLREEATPH